MVMEKEKSYKTKHGFKENKLNMRILIISVVIPFFLGVSAQAGPFDTQALPGTQPQTPLGAPQQLPTASQPSTTSQPALQVPTHAPQPQTTSPSSVQPSALPALPPGYKHIQQAALPFVAFELKDSKTGKVPLDKRTGKEVTLDTQFTLPNGKKITVGRYLEQRNSLERNLNQMGYSLRDKAAEVKIGGPSIEAATLQKQAGIISTKHLRLNVPKPGFQEELQSEKNLHLKLQPQSQKIRLAALGPANLAHPNMIAKNWDMPMGDPDSFYVDLSGRLELDGSATGTVLNGVTKADCSIVKQKLELLKITGNLKSPKSADMTASLDLSVLGNSVSVLHNTSATVWEISDKASQQISKEYKYRFSVGPVPMSVTIGARGEAGVKYYVGLAPGAITGLLTPFVHSSAYVDAAAVDIEVVSNGAGGEVVILNDDLVIKGNVSLQLDQANKPYIWQDYSALNQMDSLSGKLYLFVKVYECDFSSFSCGDKKYTLDLWDWQGFKESDYLFKDTKTNYL